MNTENVLRVNLGINPLTMLCESANSQIALIELITFDSNSYKMRWPKIFDKISAAANLINLIFPKINT